jgi:hypothetical protein
MTTCAKCGGALRVYTAHDDGTYTCASPLDRECDLRAELRDVRAVNARMACEVIELRAAVLAIADRMHNQATAHYWEGVLREAVEK